MRAEKGRKGSEKGVSLGERGRRKGSASEKGVGERGERGQPELSDFPERFASGAGDGAEPGGRGGLDHELYVRRARALSGGEHAAKGEKGGKGVSLNWAIFLGETWGRTGGFLCRTRPAERPPDRYSAGPVSGLPTGRELPPRVVTACSIRHSRRPRLSQRLSVSASLRAIGVLSGSGFAA